METLLAVRNALLNTGVPYIAGKFLLAGNLFARRIPLSAASYLKTSLWQWKCRIFNGM